MRIPKIKTKRARSRGNNRGFTLLELMVVLVVLALAAALVFPRLPSTEEGALHGSARAFAATLRYLQEQSIASRKQYTIRFRLSDNDVAVTEKDKEGKEVAVQDPFLQGKLPEEGITVEDIVMQPFGKVADGEVEVVLGPRGLQDPLVIHLKSSGGKQMTVMALPYRGRIDVLPGYKEGEAT